MKIKISFFPKNTQTWLRRGQVLAVAKFFGVEIPLEDTFREDQEDWSISGEVALAGLPGRFSLVWWQEEQNSSSFYTLWLAGEGNDALELLSVLAERSEEQVNGVPLREALGFITVTDFGDGDAHHLGGEGPLQYIGKMYKMGPAGVGFKVNLATRPMERFTISSVIAARGVAVTEEADDDV